MKENGLYYTDGSFKSQSQIRREAVLSGEYPDPIFETPLPLDKPFSYWSKRYKDRQATYKETIDRTNFAEFTFHNSTLLNFIGDLHVGTPDAYYDRIEREIETIVNTPNSYTVLMGDLVDGFFFNPAEFNQIEQAPEQFEYMRSLVHYLADNNKLLVGFAGDHDMWSAKTGLDAYRTFARETGAHYMRGVGYITANVGEQHYNIAAAHQLPGHSIYNNTHPAVRFSRENEGADIIVSGHTHRKGLSTQSVRGFGREARQVVFANIGPYKSTDDYSQKKGFTDLAPEQMFGVSIRLSKDKKLVQPYYDILQANEEFI
jgi:predicted phosphodiesterase